MAMSTEETAELRSSYELLSADELRAQLGSSTEEDALINEVLGAGKAVETKGGKAAQADADDDSDSDDDADTAAAAAPAKKVTPPNDDDDDDDDADPEADAAATAAAAGKKAEGDTTGDPVVDEEGTIEGDELIKDVSAEVPALDLGFIESNFNEKLLALDQEKADKFQELMDGVIEAKAYSKFESEYMSKRDELKTNKDIQVEWFTEVHAFKMEMARTTGINYDLDSEKGAALDDWVKRLADRPENKDRDGQWYLQQAHKKVMLEFDIVLPTAKAAKPAEKTAPAAAPAPAAKKGRAPDLSNIPPTLGGLPAAAEVDAGDASEFAYLDKLTGMAYEQALARMPADQKARYEVM